MAWLTVPGEQVLAAIIIGACTLTAALIRAYAYVRSGHGSSQKKRWPTRPGPATVLLAIGVLGAGVVLVAGPELPGPFLQRLAVAGPLFGGTEAGSATDHRDHDALSDWLMVEGLTLYYRHSRYLDDDCRGTVAVGNWADGVARPVPVRCLDDGWLALDLGPLLQRGRMVRNLTYCVNFRSVGGAWGRHAALDAPGFEDVAVPATDIPLGHAIGFRVVHQAPVDRVVLGDAYPRASC